MHSAELVFGYESPEEAEIVAAAVAREVGEIDGDRSRAEVRRADREVRVDVDADDLVALRAGLNTWSTLVEVAERTIEAGRG